MFMNGEKTRFIGIISSFLFLLVMGSQPSLAKDSYLSFSLNPQLTGNSGLNICFSQSNSFQSPKTINNDPQYSIINGSFQQSILQSRRSPLPPMLLSNMASNADEEGSETTVLEEVGYILAMETVFTGMSYLASREEGSGPLIAGGFDGLMGMAGLYNTFHQESKVQTVGHLLISAGFIAKSLYNFHYGKDNSVETKFLTNFIGYNVLVFTGYYLDTL